MELSLERPAPARPRPVRVDDGEHPAASHGSVMLLGSFDGFHRGHRAVVEAGRALAAARRAPFAIMQCDPHPRVFFTGATNFRLVMGPAQDLHLSQAGIDVVYAPRFDAAFAATPAAAFVERILVGSLRVSAVVAGADYRFGRGREGDVALLAGLGRGRGVEVQVVEDVCDGGERISSSAIRAALRGGDLARACRMLGHFWTTGILRRAGGWGFPDEQLLPPPGAWPVTALDSRGHALCHTVLTLGPGREASMPAPGHCAMIRWAVR
jgi:riboflavin kinase/FMN adenylyltransferase